MSSEDDPVGPDLLRDGRERVGVGFEAVRCEWRARRCVLFFDDSQFRGAIDADRVGDTDTPAISQTVRNDTPQAQAEQQRHLITPGQPKVREAVNEENDTPLSTGGLRIDVV